MLNNMALEYITQLESTDGLACLIHKNRES
jgi:hypothetical protein